MYFANNLNVTTVYFPSLYGVSTCNFLDSQYVIMYKEYIDGFTLKQYVEAIKDYNVGSKERIKALSESSEFFSLLGNSLYEFHYVNSNTFYKEVPDVLFLEYSDAINKALKKLEKYNSKNINTVYLSYICDELLLTMKYFPIRLGFSHGDIHFGNIMISQDKLYFIDLYRLFHSIRDPSHPMGMSNLDFYFITNFFFPLREERYRKVGKSNLLAEEVEALIRSFTVGYHRNKNYDEYSPENKFFLYISTYVIYKHVIRKTFSTKLYKNG